MRQNEGFAGGRRLVSEVVYPPSAWFGWRGGFGACAYGCGSNAGTTSDHKPHSEDSSGGRAHPCIDSGRDFGEAVTVMRVSKAIRWHDHQPLIVP